MGLTPQTSYMRAYSRAYEKTATKVCMVVKLYDREQFTGSLIHAHCHGQHFVTRVPTANAQSACGSYPCKASPHLVGDDAILF